MSSVRILIEIAFVVPFCIFMFIFVSINNVFYPWLFAMNEKFDYFIVRHQITRLYAIFNLINIVFQCFIMVIFVTH